MAQRFRVMSFLVACALLAATAQASGSSRDITVEVIDAQGAVFRQLPAKREKGAYRAYLEAERDARYRIRITNPTGTRVGVVVAVDGRNIISGARSDLEKGEPMYVLDAGDTQEYSGWRANLSEVNEFYFTEWKDSYAEAFSDRSARGVIAVAVYREKEPQQMFREREHRRSSNDAAGDLAAEAAAPAAKAERAEAGTGYGDRRVEHATRVVFDAESRAAHQVFLKYEWRETLCSKRILSCQDPPNRFWPDNAYGFAPPPPRR